MKDNLVDVIVVMGSSSGENFEKEKKTVLQAIQEDTNSDVIYGLIQYGKNAKVQMSLKERMNKDAFKRFLPSLSWSEVGEALSEGLELANVTFAEHGRDNARRIVLVFSDKPWDDSTAVDHVGTKLRESDVKIVTISVGDKSDDEKLSELGRRRPLKVDEDNDPEKTGKKVAEEIMKGRVSSVKFLSCKLNLESQARRF